MADRIFLNEEDYIFDNSFDNELELSSSESDNEKPKKTDLKKFDSKSRINMINMRSHINKVKENVKEKSYKLEQFQNELQLCDNHILELKKEQEMTTESLAIDRANENIAALFRLQGTLKRIEIELEGEGELRKQILDKVNKAEQDFIRAQLEEGQTVLDEHILKEDEEAYQKNVLEISEKRINKEKKLTKNGLKTLEAENRHLSTIELENQQSSIAVGESVKAAHLNHAKYLKNTVQKERQAKKQLEMQIIERQTKKEKSFLKLNSEISHIKANLSAIQCKRDADSLAEKTKEMELRNHVAQKGGNPNLEINIKKKQMAIEQDKEKFLNSLKEKQLKIADKLLAEEENLKRKKKLMPQLFEDRLKLSKNVSKNPFAGISKIKMDIQENEKREENVEETWKSWDIRSSAGRSSYDGDNPGDTGFMKSYILEDSNKATVESTFQSSYNSKNAVEQDINAPEFEGLWDTTVNYSVPKINNQPIKTENASKMDQNIMNRVLYQLKENIIQPQIVNGKVFKGHSFQSKPETIQFENLVVDEKYQQKIILTNTSYCTNQCRFERISENLLDFVSIKFIPPGPLSPGMTCEFIVYFQPKLDQDLFGEIYFTCQSEKFSIPVACLTKKCKMTIDKHLVKFDTSVIGETLIQSVKLKNSGAKGTFCKLKNKSQLIEDSSNKIADENVLNTNNEEKQDLPEIQSITTSMDNLTLWIEPHGEQEIMVKWSPLFSGDYLEDFFISFEDEDNKGFDLRVLGKAIDVPVYMEDQTISMDICMLDRLYQDTIIFNSRAATALKLQFHVPAEMKDYLEILPNSGFIQGGQNFKAQMKLLVKPSIYTDNCQYFDSETGILDVPINTSIANQVKTVDFNLQAILTVTDLEIIVPNCETNSLDFGNCTIRETNVKTIQLVNKSILPQEFGFTGYPEYVEIQPNFGYGIILPKEVLEFQVLFSPPKADDFKFQLRCQTLIDRIFSISCSGVGVHPAVEISSNILSFPHTAIDDRSKLEIFIQNNHLSTNIYTHEPPRIGNGQVVAIGPQTFQFIIPDQIPIFIHPRFGSLNPGEKQKISIFFEPKFLDETIKTEASIICNRKLEIKANSKWKEEVSILKAQKKEEEEHQEKQEAKSKKSAKKPNRPTSEKNNNNKSLDELIQNGPAPIEKINPRDIITDSDEYLKGKLSLMQKFDFNLEIFKIKCLLTDGHINDRSSKLIYNPDNTLYLELHCPSVRPDLILLSNSGRSTLEFGEVIITNKVTNTISIQNISSDFFQLKSTLLNPNGAFQICNAVRALKPNGVTNITVAFCPTEEGIYQSNWSVFGHQRNKILNVTFKGKAIIPKIEFKEMTNGVFDSGIVLVNEFSERPLTIVNTSSVNIDYRFDLFSQTNTNLNMSVGNKNALSVFNIVPRKGTVPAGKSQTVTVSFAPDHASDRFLELVKCFLFENVELTTFPISGKAKTNIMYLRSQSDDVDRIVEYLGETWTAEYPKPDDTVVEETASLYAPLILQAIYTSDGVIQEAKCSFSIGCVRTLAVSQKKNGEFNIDNLNLLTPLGFTVDPAKGQVEADCEKVVNLSWVPNSTYQIGSVVSTTMMITLKGETASTHSIEIRGLVL